jgi:hypothetical protein
MIHTRGKHLLLVGLLIAGTGAAQTRAQDAPAPVAVGDGLVSGDPVYSQAPAVPAPGTCTCGDRHGLSRWRWHRTQCKRLLQEHLLGYAEEFNEWPLGACVDAQARTQATNGLAARMVFYHYDFEEGTSQLNVRGRDKLAAVAATLPTTFLPVVVERTPRAPGLDSSRRSVVLAQLAQGNFPVPPQRVVIGPGIAHGMTGVESNVIFLRQLSSLGSGGSAGTAATASGLDGSGLSGSAVAGGVR